MEKDDKVQDIGVIAIDEWIQSYYTDTFSPGKTKEQLEVSLDVRTPSINRTYVRTSFVSVSTPERIQFLTRCRAVRIQANFSTGGYTGYNDITVNTRDGTWSGIHFARNGWVVQCTFDSGDIPSQASSGIDFIRCVDTSGGGIQVGRLNAISEWEMTITWTTTVSLTYNITYIL